PLSPGAAAGRARILDHRAVSAAARAGLREREKALALGDHAAAAALRADLRRRPGLCARPVARVACELERDRNLHLGAVQRVLEREVDLHLDVVAALRGRRSGAAAEAAAAEHPAEQVAEVEVDALG